MSPTAGITGRFDPADVPADWMSPAEFAEWVGISRAGVYKLVEIGAAPRVTRVGHRNVRFSRQAIAAWLTERTAA